jgi:hypothetical protein
MGSPSATNQQPPSRLTKDSCSKIGKIAMAIAFAFVMCGVAVRPAMAEHEDHHHDGRHHEKRHYRGRREHRPDVVYYAPSPYVYYAPPPVVYVPPPPSWGINLFFPLRIR